MRVCDFCKLNEVDVKAGWAEQHGIALLFTLTDESITKDICEDCLTSRLYTAVANWRCEYLKKKADQLRAGEANASF